jgi:hypothetical protein
MNHTLTALALAIGFTMSACAAHAAGIVTFGWATSSCGVWLQHPDANDVSHQAMGAWFDGYLTAANDALWHQGKPGMLGATTDIAGRDAWITKYCQAHPLNTLYAAAAALTVELEKTGR